LQIANSKNQHFLEVASVFEICIKFSSDDEHLVLSCRLDKNLVRDRR